MALDHYIVIGDGTFFVIKLSNFVKRGKSPNCGWSVLHTTETGKGRYRYSCAGQCGFNSVIKYEEIERGVYNNILTPRTVQYLLNTGRVLQYCAEWSQQREVNSKVLHPSAVLRTAER